MKPKIIILDIETSPLLGWAWGKYEQTINKVDRDWFILSFSYKELDNKKTYCYSLADFKNYKKDRYNDHDLIKKLYEVLSDVDIIIGHNLDQFDMKKINSRFIFHGFNNPNTYKTIDTWKIAKKYFAFTSNKLNDLCQHFNIGKKVKHSGFDLWLDCIAGKKQAWDIMKKYNKVDVDINERLYKKMLPYITNHPNMGLYEGKEIACPNCGSGNLIKRGFTYTKVNKYQRVYCKDCGAWSTERNAVKTVIKTKLKN